MLSVTVKKEEKIKADKFADELSEQDCTSFWKKVKKLNRNRLPPVNSVDNISGDGAIAEVWQEHYESILNCVDQSEYKNKVTATLCNTKFDSGMHVSVAP